MRMSPVMGGVPFMGVFFMGFLLSHGIHLSQSKRETLIDFLFPKWKIFSWKVSRLKDMAGKYR